MPMFSFVFFLFILGNIAFPGLFSFIGELYVVVGILSLSLSAILLSLPSFFLTTAYSVNLYSRIIFGYSNGLLSNFKLEMDLTLIDLLFFLPFLLVICVWGVYPPSLLISLC